MNNQTQVLSKTFIMPNGRIMLTQTPMTNSHYLDAMLKKIGLIRKYSPLFNGFSNLLYSFSWTISSSPGYVQNTVNERRLFLAVALGVLSSDFTSEARINNLPEIIFEELAAVFIKDKEWLNHEIEHVRELVTSDYKFNHRVKGLIAENLREKNFWLYDKLIM